MKSVSMAEKTLSGRGGFTRGVATMKKVTFLKALVAVLVLGIAIWFLPASVMGSYKSAFLEINAGVNSQIVYINENGESKTLPESTNIIVLSETYLNSSKQNNDDGDGAVLNAGWYFVNESISIEYPIELRGDVKLILGDRAGLSIGSLEKDLKYGIYGQDYNLTVYSQCIDPYDLSYDSPDRTMGSLYAAGDIVGIMVKKLTINGGYVIFSTGASSTGYAGAEVNNMEINGGRIQFSGRDQGAIINDNLIINGGSIDFFLLWNRDQGHNSICGPLSSGALDIYLNGGNISTSGIGGRLGKIYLNFKSESDEILFQPSRYTDNYNFSVAPGKSFALHHPTISQIVPLNNDGENWKDYNNIVVYYSTISLAKGKCKITFKFDDGRVWETAVDSGTSLYTIEDANSDIFPGTQSPNFRYFYIYVNGEFDEQYGSFQFISDCTVYVRYSGSVDVQKLKIVDAVYNGSAQKPKVIYDNDILGEKYFVSGYHGGWYYGQYQISRYKKGETVLQGPPVEPGDYIVTLEGQEYLSLIGTVDIPFKIVKKKVTVSGIRAENKEFDNTASAVLNFDNAVFSDIIEGDVLGITADGSFVDSAIGENKEVRLSNVVLTGDKAGFYTPVIEQEITANITKRKISIKALDQEVVLGRQIDTGNDKYSITSGSILSGHSLAAVSLSSSSTDTITDSGNINVGSVVIKNGEKDVTDYYEITILPGTLTVVNGALSSMTSPNAKTLQYNGTLQELVTAGTSDDGDVLYALGQDDVTAPASGYTDQIPRKRDAGTYYVWYMLKGNSTHVDIAPACIVVKIKKNPITITVLDQRSKKGESIVQLTYTLSGTIVSGDDLRITLYTTATSASAAGEYTIVASYSGNDNYDVTAVSGTYTIENPDPTGTPSPDPTGTPTPDPTGTPTPDPTGTPTPDPTGTPTPDSTGTPTPDPTGTPTPDPTGTPTPDPAGTPTPDPTGTPTPDLTGTPTPEPSQEPGKDPTPIPSQSPNPMDPDDHGNVVDTVTTEDEKGNVNTHTVIEYSDGNVRETDVTEKKNGDIIEKDVVSDSEGNVIQTSVETVSTNKKGTEISEKTVVNNDGSQENSSRTETTSGKVTEKYYSFDSTGTGIYTVNTTTATGGQRTVIYELNSSGEATLVSFETTGKKAKIPEEITFGDKKYLVVRNEDSLVTTKSGTRKGKIRIVAEMAFIRDITFEVEINFDKVPSKKAMKTWKLTLKNAKKVKVYITTSTKKEYKSLKKSFKTRLKQIKADTKKFKFKRIKSN